MNVPFCISLLALPALLVAQESAWLTDFGKAKAVAKEKKLPILAYFTGSDWNHHCQLMQAEVFDQKEFLDWANKAVILLAIDRPRDKKLDESTKKQTDELNQSYKITTFPTVVILDAEGCVQGKIPGFVSGGPASFIGEVKKCAVLEPAGADGAKGADAAKGADGAAKPADAQTPPAKKDPTKDAPKQEQPVWLTSYADALAKAKKERKLVLVDFTGSDWCRYCQKLKADVFDKPDFQKWAEKNVVLLEVDFPKRHELPAELKAHNEKVKKDLRVTTGYPTILLLDATGKKVGQTVGYDEQAGAGAWLKNIDKLAKKAKGG